jgi:hypothetical protein
MSINHVGDDKADPSGSRARALTIAARIIGSLAAGGWVFVLIAGALGGGADEYDVDDESVVVETVGIISGAVLNVSAVVVAWRNPRVGGALTVAAGLLFVGFALWSAGRNQALAAAVSGGPFVLAGVLFLAADRAARRGV